MKKDILHIIQGGKGGTLEYLKSLLPLFNKENYDITVICHGEIFYELKQLGYKVINIEMKRAIAPINDLRALFQISNYIKSNKVDIVHTHSSKAGFLGRLAAKWHKIPCIYNPHGWSFNIKTNIIKKNIYKVIERIASNWANKIVAISEAEYQSALKEKICNPKKLILIENGIDLKKYNPETCFSFKQELGINEKYKIIGMSARLTKQKDPITFIEIAKRVTEECRDCKFMLVGDGELREQVENRIKQYNLEDKIVLTGWTNCPEKYINIFDIGVLTSLWEGFGLSLAEYMACGKPIVASRVDGIPFVVRHSIDGFLCEPGNINDFCESIIMLLNNEDLYYKISRTIIERARNNFSIDRVVKKHEELYAELVN
ncbi:MAG: glycosyltransferase family 4 protein [Ignavibacteriales bacterium]